MIKILKLKFFALVVFLFTLLSINSATAISLTNSLPLVSISNLTNNSVFANATNVLIQVQSYDLDGIITRTELYGDSYLIAFSSSSNLNYNWNNIGAGNHNVYARTTDNSNGIVNSSVLNFSIVTNSPPPVINSDINAVTSYTLARIRNDFNGFLGFKFTVGTNALAIKSLGRFNHLVNNTNTHLLRITDTNGIDVTKVVLNTKNQPFSQFAYTNLLNPIILNSLTPYYLISQESAGGDFWATDNYGVQDTLITTTSDITNNGPILNNTLNSNIWTLRTLVNGTFEPLDFKYQLINTNIITPPINIPKGFFVSTNGTSSANGSITNPIDLQTALNHPNFIKPGDTIWLREGIYSHAPQGATVNPANQGWIFFSKLTGNATNPIIVRSYPNEHVVINGGAWAFLNANARPTIEIQGAYTWFMDLEITSLSNEARFSPDDSSFPVSITRSDGPYVHGVGIKFINLVVHDLTAGISSWSGGDDFEAYGNVCYNNGWQGTPHTHGHNVYTQNYVTSNLKTFLFNFFINAYQNNVQAYGSSSAAVAHYRFLNNFSVNRPFLVGGRTDCHLADNQVINNYLYNSDMALIYSFGTNYIDIIARANYIVDGMFQIGAWQKAAVDGNTVITTKGGVLADIIPATPFTPLPLWNWSGNTYFAYNKTTPLSINKNNFAVEGESFMPFATWKTRSLFDNNSTYTVGLPITNRKK